MRRRRQKRKPLPRYDRQAPTRRRQHPEGIPAPYKRGSGSVSILTASEALVEIGEEIPARMPDPAEDAPDAS